MNNKKFGIANANDVVLYDLNTGKVVTTLESAVLSIVSEEPTVEFLNQDKHVYNVIKYYKGGGEHTWAVEGTLKEIEKLSFYLVHEDGYKLVSHVKHYPVPFLKATHKFDENGQLWCVTPININS